MKGWKIPHKTPERHFFLGHLRSCAEQAGFFKATRSTACKQAGRNLKQPACPSDIFDAMLPQQALGMSKA